jgi:AcrR family transcriptional regulator
MNRETKDFILEAAAGCFLQKGFKAVTMNELVQKTGLTKGAFYHYFASKELLFKAVIEKSVSLTLKVTFQTEGVSLRQFYHDYAEYFAASQPMRAEQGNGTKLNYFILIIDALNMFPDFADRIHESYRRQQKYWEDVIASAKATGEIGTTMTDEHIAKMFIHSSDGLSMSDLLFGDGDIKKSLLVLWDDFYGTLKK